MSLQKQTMLASFKNVTVISQTHHHQTKLKEDGKLQSIHTLTVPKLLKSLNTNYVVHQM